MKWLGVGVLSTSKGEVKEGGEIPPDSLPEETIKSLLGKGKIEDDRKREAPERSDSVHEGPEISGRDSEESLPEEVPASKKRGRRPKKGNERG